MLRLASFPFCLVLAITVASGCATPTESESDCEPTSKGAEFGWVEDRYALGSRATIRVSGETPLTLESSNPEVARVDELVERTATLSFVGVGRATLVLENEVSVASHVVEVAPHDSFLVVLSELIPLPLGPLTDQVLLAGQQNFMVIYLDAEGRRLCGDGLAEFELSPGLRRCDEGLGLVEFHCLFTDEPGAHVLEVSVGDERLVFPFETVLQSDIVAIELLQPDEEELISGTWVQVDVVGVTDEGMHVAGVHPRFEVDQDLYAGYFAYQYDPEALPRTLVVEALDWRKQTEFRGVPSEETAFGCSSTGPGSQGPIPAIVTLFALVLLIRREAKAGTIFGER